MAEHVLLAPGTAILRLPEELPLAVACPANCATATVAAALSAAGDLRERNVCVFGAGLLGLTACAMLQDRGAAQIVCVDVNESRLPRARQFGATRTVTPSNLTAAATSITAGHGFDVALEFSGSSAAFESGFAMLRLGGALLLIGAVFPTPPVAISPEQIVRRNLTLRGVHNYVPRDLLEAVGFLARRHRDFPFAELVADWLPLASASQAFELGRDRNRIRVGVRP